MYPRNRSKKVCNRQTKSRQSIKKTIKMSSHPICVRNDAGFFEFYNSVFARCLLYPFSTAELWLSELPFNLRKQISEMELSILNNEKSICIIKNIVVDNVDYDIFIQLFKEQSSKYLMWQFVRSDKVKFKNEEGLFIFKGRERIIKVFREEKSELHWKVLILHSFGYSHSVISTMLGIKKGTSRNIIMSIHAYFNVSCRDDLVTLLISSGCSVSAIREVENIVHDSLLQGRLI